MTFVRGLVFGVVVTVLLGAIGVLAYFGLGFVPVSVAAKPMPFEARLAALALRAHIRREMPQTVPISGTSEELVEGARVFRSHCAMCHGLPNQPSALHLAMYPHPPQLLQGDGVTDDPPGETYWKVDHGIRLTGMPAFGQIFSSTQRWQVSLMLKRAEELPAQASDVLGAAPAP